MLYEVITLYIFKNGITLMADWNTLFTQQDNRRQLPETSIENFAGYLTHTYKDGSIRVWDLCCGAGRHTVV